MNRNQLRSRRQELQDRLHYASWIAIAGGVFTIILTVIAAFGGELDLQSYIYLLAAIGIQFLMAYQIRDRHEFATGSMVVGYSISLAWQSFHQGRFPGLPAFGFLVLYVRAFMAVIELVELDELYGPEQRVS